MNPWVNPARHKNESDNCRFYDVVVRQRLKWVPDDRDHASERKILQQMIDPSLSSYVFRSTLLKLIELAKILEG